jgi:CRP-like cAMP-binding protein
MDARELKDKATAAFAGKKFGKAAELLEEYCKLDQKDLQARLRCGDAWAKAGKKEKAVVAYAWAAEGFARDGFLPRAIAASKLVLELDPAHKAVQKMLADLYARKSSSPSRISKAPTAPDAVPPDLPGLTPEGSTSSAAPSSPGDDVTRSAGQAGTAQGYQHRADAIDLDAPAPAKVKPAAPARAAPAAPQYAANAIDLPDVEIPIERGRSSVGGMAAATGPSPLNRKDAIDIDLGEKPVTARAAPKPASIDLDLPPTATPAPVAVPAPPPPPPSAPAPALATIEIDLGVSNTGEVEIPIEGEPVEEEQPSGLDPAVLAVLRPPPTLPPPTARRVEIDPTPLPKRPPPPPPDPFLVEPPRPPPAPKPSAPIFELDVELPEAATPIEELLVTVPPRPPADVGPPPGLKPKKNEPTIVPPLQDDAPRPARPSAPPAVPAQPVTAPVPAQPVVPARAAPSPPPMAPPPPAAGPAAVPAPPFQSSASRIRLPAAFAPRPSVGSEALPATARGADSELAKSLSSLTQTSASASGLAASFTELELESDSLLHAVEAAAAAGAQGALVSEPVEEAMEAPDDTKLEPGALPKIPLFSDLPEDAFIALFERCPLRRYDEGQLIIEQGQTGEAFFVICAGRVRVFRDDSGTRLDLATLEEGAFFGEMALLSDSPRTASVEAGTEDTQLLEISAQLLTELSGNHPTVAQALKKFCRQRLLANLMASAPLFKPFGRTDRRDLIQRFRAREVRTGDVVIKQGAESDGLYVVLSGEVEVRVEGGSVASLREGEIFGEMSLLTKQPAAGTVVSKRHTSLLRLPRADFDELVLSHPQILEQLSELTDARRRSNQHLV